MEWVNIHTSTLRSSDYLGSEPTARATWFNVLAWCCAQENSGRIENCRHWKDRQWQQICGVTSDEVTSSTPLLSWQNDDLIVWGYPIDKQKIVQTKRKNGAVGGKSVSEAKAEASRLNGAKHKPKQNPSKDPSRSQAEPKQEPNGREGKGMEGNGKEHNLAPAKAAAKAPKERNELLDALAVIGGGNPSEVPPSKWSGIAKALADIKAVAPDLTVDELQRRARNYRRHFEGAALTPFALASHWAICGSGKSDGGPSIQR